MLSIKLDGSWAKEGGMGRGKSGRGLLGDRDSDRDRASERVRERWIERWMDTSGRSKFSSSASSSLVSPMTMSKGSPEGLKGRWALGGTDGEGGEGEFEDGH
mmetsp:Transcript_45342/g.58120  ORF Transcript_45342/g.58120 Transcript_45342/m.58120 type:complete len:102 (+) Transcript_45342:762-1067(+)